LPKLFHPEPGSASVNRIVREQNRLIVVAILARRERISRAGIKQQDRFPDTAT